MEDSEPKGLFFTPEELRALLLTEVRPKLEAVKRFYDQPAIESFTDEKPAELVRLFTEFAKEVGDSSGLILYGLGSEIWKAFQFVGDAQPGKKYEIIDAVLEQLQEVENYCAEQPPEIFGVESRQHCLELYLDFMQECANTAARITSSLSLNPDVFANAFGGTGKYLLRPTV